MKFEITDSWSDPRAEKGLQQLREYNNSKNCPINYTQFSIIMEDDSGNPQAIIRACTEWNWIFVNTLFVYNKGHGNGRKIMEYLETWAQQRGHTGINLGTSTFQTPAFYDAMGYECVGRIPNFINGYDRLFYAKRLS